MTVSTEFSDSLTNKPYLGLCFVASRADFYVNLQNDGKELKKVKDFIDEIVSTLLSCRKNGHKIFLVGNGGSNALASHFAAELVGRYKKDREPFPAICLKQNSSITTCISNDYSYIHTSIREYKALSSPDDIVIFFSTSGNSMDLRTLALFIKNKEKIFSFLGKGGGELAKFGHTYVVPSADTAIIQEFHEAIMHEICERLEEC